MALTITDAEEVKVKWRFAKHVQKSAEYLLIGIYSFDLSLHFLLTLNNISYLYDRQREAAFKIKTSS